MPIGTSAAGGTIAKIIGIPVVAGAIGTAFGFIVMWPKTIREAFVRFACAILSSFTVGPALVIAARALWPELFESAKAAGVMYGLDPLVALLFIAAPFMVLAALPAWWVLGAVVLWLDRRKGKDIGEMAHDAAAAVKDVREAL